MTKLQWAEAIGPLFPYSKQKFAEGLRKHILDPETDKDERKFILLIYTLTAIELSSISVLHESTPLGLKTYFYHHIMRVIESYKKTYDSIEG